MIRRRCYLPDTGKPPSPLTTGVPSTGAVFPPGIEVGLVMAEKGGKGLVVGKTTAAAAAKEKDKKKPMSRSARAGLETRTRARLQAIRLGMPIHSQVYMESMFENQYMLLARAGNMVHEI